MDTDSFFTLGTFATLTGCSTIVLIATGVLRHALKWNPRYVALIVSMICAFVAANIPADQGGGGSAALPSLWNWALVAANGFLIYATAFGIQGNLSGGPPGNDGKGDETARQKAWRTAW